MFNGSVFNILREGVGMIHCKCLLIQQYSSHLNTHYIHVTRNRVNNLHKLCSHFYSKVVDFAPSPIFKNGTS